MDADKMLGGMGMIGHMLFTLVVGLLFTLMLFFGEPVGPVEV